jgi:hypothetical protein
MQQFYPTYEKRDMVLQDCTLPFAYVSLPCQIQGPLGLLPWDLVTFEILFNYLSPIMVNDPATHNPQNIRGVVIKSVKSCEDPSASFFLTLDSHGVFRACMLHKPSPADSIVTLLILIHLGIVGL